MVNLTVAAVVTLLISLQSLCPCILGKSLVNPRHEPVITLNQDKVHQTGGAGGFAHSVSESLTQMHASSGMGTPAGIIAQSGTATGFSTSSVVDQNVQDNTSTITSQAMTSNCGAGLVSGQLGGHGVGLSSISNCDSIVISNPIP